MQTLLEQDRSAMMYFFSFSQNFNEISSLVKKYEGRQKYLRKDKKIVLFI